MRLPRIPRWYAPALASRLTNAALARLPTALHPLGDTVDELRNQWVTTRLDVQQLEALGIAMFDVGASTMWHDIEPWEHRIWQQHLPAAPAQILVLGAGEGRETLALIAMGHDVEAVEPAPGVLTRLWGTVSERALAMSFDHQGTIDLVDSGAHLRRGPYDAIVVGLGAFSHLLGGARRRQFLRSLRALCPIGPVFLSWVRADSSDGRLTTGPVTAAPRSDRLRGGPAVPPVVPLPRNAASEAAAAMPPVDPGNRHTAAYVWEIGDTFDARLGPLHSFADGEVGALAAELGERAVVDETGGYPHAVLWPGGALVPPLASSMRAGVEDRLFLDALAQTGRAQLRARGHSMRRAIEDGTDLVVEAATARTDWRRGDIAVAPLLTGMVVHRVQAVEGNGKRLLLGGDNVLHSDGWVLKRQLAGRVIGRAVGGRASGDVAAIGGRDPPWLDTVSLSRRIRAKLANGAKLAP